MRLGRKTDALRELEHSLTLEIDDINAHLEKIEAEGMLSRLRREFRGSVTPLSIAWGGGGGGEAA